MDRINKYKYPGAKRLMLEAQELKDNTEDYWAQPIEDNLFEWHFTVRGPPDTVFDGGFYHGRISFPTDYPMKPPSIILLTPNGRFETNKKICLSISGYHPETWQPSWSIRTALLALIAFMPTKANGAIGSLDLPDVERRRLAKKSQTWKCQKCGCIKDLLIQPTQPTPKNSTNNSDKIPAVSTSNHVSQIVGNHNQSGPEVIIGAVSSNTTADPKDSTESLQSSTYKKEQKRKETDKLDSSCIGTRENSTNSSPVPNGVNDGLGNDHEQSRNISNQDSMNPQSSIPQHIPYRRSYSMVIFSMAFLLILLILRRLFFVVL